ncbi:hypothetical protein BGX33_011734 [Mortierella sp. NVP41]|nr:hypothetical protein BGX33_011734 [Mortierella sp. NVP41]
MAYASRLEKALYIQGGISWLNPAAFNNQLFSLDLTVSPWDSSNPPWKYLAVPSGQQSSYLPAKNRLVISPNESQALLFDGSVANLWAYNIGNDTWLPRRDLPGTIAFGSNYTVAADPSSSYLYLSNGGTKGTAMLVFDTASGNSWPQDMPLELSSFIKSYSFVYCPSRKSFLLFGGKSSSYVQDDLYNSDLFEFQLAAYKWVRLNTQGSAPVKIYSHCMVPAYDGFKMVVFGGSLKDDVQLGDIYILDVPTMTWTQGPSVAASQNRSGMACTVGGDNFVAWGGYNAEKAVDGTPIIYNLRTNQWTTTYSLRTGPKTHVGEIIGGVVAAIVVGAGLGYFFYRRRKRARAGENKNNVQQTHKQHQDQGMRDGQQEDPYLQSDGQELRKSGKQRAIEGEHWSPSMSSITPLFARNNSARFSVNSQTSTSQPPVALQELYEKGYYVPESDLRNPQCLEAAEIPYAEMGKIPLGGSELPRAPSTAYSPWMTPNSGRRNPQDYSQHHLLARSASGVSGVTGTTIQETTTPDYHEARSNYSDAQMANPPVRIRDDDGIPHNEAADQNIYHSPLQSAIPLAPSIVSAVTAVELTSGESDQSRDKDEDTLKQEMAMIHAQQAQYEQNVEWFRQESERLEQERLAYLDRLAQLQRR